MRKYLGIFIICVFFVYGVSCNSEDSASEEFVDGYIGWTFNKLEDSRWGEKRRNWMNTFMVTAVDMAANR